MRPVPVAVKSDGAERLRLSRVSARRVAYWLVSLTSERLDGAGCPSDGRLVPLSARGAALGGPEQLGPGRIDRPAARTADHLEAGVRRGLAQIAPFELPTRDPSCAIRPGNARREIKRSFLRYSPVQNVGAD